MTQEEKFLLLSIALINENDSEDEVINLIDSIINNEYVE